MYFSLLIVGAPFVGHDANDHNLLLKGAPFYNAISSTIPEKLHARLECRAWLSASGSWMSSIRMLRPPRLGSGLILSQHAAWSSRSWSLASSRQLRDSRPQQRFCYRSLPSIIVGSL